MEALHKRFACGRAIRIGHHDIGHVGPPALANIGSSDRVPPLLALNLRITEKFVGFRVEVDRVVGDAVFTQRGFKLRPDWAVAADIFIGCTSFYLKKECFADVHGSTSHPSSVLAANANICFYVDRKK